MNAARHRREEQPEWEPVSPEWEGVADIIMAHQRIPMYDDSRPFAQRCTGLGCDSLKGESDGPNSPRHAWHLADLIIAQGWVSPEEAKAREAAARREALLEAKTLAAGRYSAWLPSPGLSSDWVAGWHAASNDITTTLQVAIERADAPCSCGSRDATSLTPGERLHHSPDGCTIERGGEDGR